EAEQAQRVLGPSCNDLSKCEIFVTSVDGLWYFHSNYVQPGCIYPVKLLAERVRSLQFVVPFIAGVPGIEIFTRDDLLAHHIRDIHYRIDGRVVSSNSS